VGEVLKKNEKSWLLFMTHALGCQLENLKNRLDAVQATRDELRRVILLPKEQGRQQLHEARAKHRQSLEELKVAQKTVKELAGKLTAEYGETFAKLMNKTINS